MAKNDSFVLILIFAVIGYLILPQIALNAGIQVTNLIGGILGAVLGFAVSLFQKS